MNPLSGREKIFLILLVFFSTMAYSIRNGVDRYTNRHSPPPRGTKMYFAIAVMPSEQSYSRAFNKAVMNITQTYLDSRFKRMGYNFTLETLVIDLPENGSFSAGLLETVCEKFEGKYVVSVLVIGNTPAARTVSLAATHSGISVLWARGQGGVVSGFRSLAKSTEIIIDKNDNIDNLPQSTSTVTLPLGTYELDDNGALSKLECDDAIDIEKIEMETVTSGNLTETETSYIKCNETKKTKSRNNITSYVDTLTVEEENKINDALSKFIFGYGLPFSVVESPLFKNFIKVLRPAYADKIPGRKKLSGSLLETCYNECIEKAKQNLSEGASIVCGWKNSTNNCKTVATMLQSADGGSAFLEAWDLSTESETADKLAEILLESKNIAKTKFNIDCSSVVSDNASDMLKMGKLLAHTIWYSTCSSHTGNLLAKDVLDKALVDNVVTILKEFNSPDLEKLIVLSGGHRIKLPAETRWCSYRDSFASLLDNLGHMKHILASTKKKIKPKVTELVFNDDFISEVKENLEIHTPICTLINTCQKDDTSVADAVKLWLNLKLPIKFSDILKSRQEMALNIYALSAFYLHPKYNNSDLTATHRSKVYSFMLNHLSHKGIEEFDKFNMKTGIFQLLNEKNLVKPFVFWRMAQNECPELSKLAFKLLRIPASSAQLERIFSNWGHVHTLLLNRLTFEKSKKLIHIYYTLKYNNPVEEDVDSDLEFL